MLFHSHGTQRAKVRAAMKIRAGKVAPKGILGGDYEANVILHAYLAKKRLAKVRKGTRWLLAANAATTRYLLIGEPEK